MKLSKLTIKSLDNSDRVKYWPIPINWNWLFVYYNIAEIPEFRDSHVIVKQSTTYSLDFEYKLIWAKTPPNDNSMIWDYRIPRANIVTAHKVIKFIRDDRGAIVEAVYIKDRSVEISDKAGLEQFKSDLDSWTNYKQ